MIFPSNVYTEFYNGTAWVNISSYVVSEISGRGGFYSSSPSEFTAGVGMSNFVLDNSTGLFTVYGGDSIRGLNTLTGWNIGTKIRHRVTYQHYNEVVWLGFVQNVASDDGIWGEQKAQVTCLDWMDIASNYPMKRSDILLNKTLGEGVQSIVNRISLAPEGVVTGTYSTTFETIFSNVKEKTKAIGEIDKLAKSETGLVYLLKNGYLMVEGGLSRKGTDSLSTIPSAPDNALLIAPYHGLMVSNDNVLLLDGIQEPGLYASAESLQLTMRDEHWSEANIKGYPTAVDSSLINVYDLGVGAAVPIAAGATIHITGNYTDPNGGRPINATNQQSPVVTTDYLMNTKADGTGTNISSFLTVVPVYYGDVVEYTLTNTYTALGYIRRLRARGYGIYRNSYLENRISVTGSATAYGEKGFDLNQTYQTDPYAGTAYAASILEQYHTPKTRINEVSYCANINSEHMMAFLKLDIGSLIKVYDNRSGMNKWFYIISRKFVILLGGIIVFSYGLQEQISLANGGLNPVAVKFDGTNVGDAINFGYLPEVAGDEVTELTIAMRVNLQSVWVNFTTFLNIASVGGANTYVYVQGSAGSVTPTFFAQRFDGGAGRWSTPTNSMVTGTWTHLVVTYNINVNADPVMYINGVSQTVSEGLTPSGDLISAIGTQLIIGNTDDYGNGINAYMKDIRIYDRILTPTEVVTLYNGGVVDPTISTDNLVFQGLSINADLGDADSLNGQTIPADNKFFENVHRRVGSPNKTPTISNQ